jgi:hypothetical protein
MEVINHSLTPNNNHPDRVQQFVKKTVGHTLVGALFLTLRIAYSGTPV